MKNGFKLFLSVCFIFTFVFSLAFAGPGEPELICDSCCFIEATQECSSGWGLLTEDFDGVCWCDVSAPSNCPPAPQCF